MYSNFIESKGLEMSFDVDKFGKTSGIELNTLNAGMKKKDLKT